VAAQLAGGGAQSFHQGRRGTDNSTIGIHEARYVSPTLHPWCSGSIRLANLRVYTWPSQTYNIPTSLIRDVHRERLASQVNIRLARIGVKITLVPAKVEVDLADAGDQIGRWAGVGHFEGVVNRSAKGRIRHHEPDRDR
jgi:hypothetical protein